MESIKQMKAKLTACSLNLYGQKWRHEHYVAL